MIPMSPIYRIPKIKDYPKLKEVYTKTTLFNFDYTEPSEYSADAIESVIYNHYKNYRIGVDTDDPDDVEEWHDYFEARIQEIMPTYAKLFDSLEIEFDPLMTKDIAIHATTAHDALNTDDSANSGTTGTQSTGNSTQTNEQVSEHAGESITDDANSSVTSRDTSGTDGKTSTRTDDLKEVLESDSTRTDDLSETISGAKSEAKTSATTSAETSEGMATRADDLYTTESGTMDHNSTEAKSRYENSNIETEKRFSDMPQGSVANIDDGYLTTYGKDGEAKNGSSVDSGTGEAHDTSARTVENGGTQDTASSSNVNRDQSTDEATNEQHDEVKSNEGTQVTETDQTKTNTGTQKVVDSGNSSESTDEESESTGTSATVDSSTDRSNGQTSNTEASATQGTHSDEAHARHAIDEDTEHNETIKGYEGYPVSDLILKYRETIVNYNKMLIREVADLFILVF